MKTFIESQSTEKKQMDQCKLIDLLSSLIIVF